MKNIRVFSRKEISSFFETETVDKPTIVISISNSDGEKPRVLRRNLENVIEKLYLFFDDVDTTDTYLQEFQKDDAKNILDFVKRNLNLCDNIFIHCCAGISRSTGVAAALSKVLNGNDEYYFKRYCPNMLVYRTILDYYYNEYGKELKESVKEKKPNTRLETILRKV